MTISQLNQPDFDRFHFESEKSRHDDQVRADQAFAAAMNRAIKRGNVKVVAGTFVDHSPNYGARRYYGEAETSACGSPSAMCTE